MVLEWLFREGPLTAEELEGRTGLGRSALYGRLRECRQNGWVKPSEKLLTSRRDSYIITDSGARLLKPVPGGSMVMVISEVTPPTDPRYENITVQMKPGEQGRFRRVGRKRVKGGDEIEVVAEGTTIGRAS
jgi:hypothetical protein